MTETPTDSGWYSEDAATFGDRVAAAREAAGLVQRELAEHLGVKLKTLVAWENDMEEPRANKLQMLAGMLNVSMRWMLTGVGEGVSHPEDGAEIPADISKLLIDLREMRGEASALAARLGLLEKRLRSALKEQP